MRCTRRTLSLCPTRSPRLGQGTSWQASLLLGVPGGLGLLCRCGPAGVKGSRRSRRRYWAGDHDEHQATSLATRLSRPRKPLPDPSAGASPTLHGLPPGCRSWWQALGPWVAIGEAQVGLRAVGVGPLSTLPAHAHAATPVAAPGRHLLDGCGHTCFGRQSCRPAAYGRRLRRAGRERQQHCSATQCPQRSVHAHTLALPGSCDHVAARMRLVCPHLYMVFDRAHMYSLRATGASQLLQVPGPISRTMPE